MHCPSCGAAVPDGNAFCGTCGAGVEGACASCGAPRIPGNAFCTKCGTRFGVAPVMPPPEAHMGTSRPPTRPGGMWIPLGYLFSVLVGLPGMAVGGHLWGARVRDAHGVKRPKFDAPARKHGFSQIILGGAFFALSLQAMQRVDFGNMFARSLQTSTTFTPTTPPETPAGGGPAGGAALAATVDRNDLDEYEQLVLTYLDTAFEVNLQSDGFRATEQVYVGTLGNADHRDLAIRLPGGADLALLGVCDNECSDVDLVLFDEDGNLLEEDRLVDDVPILHTTSAGIRTVRVGMATCDEVQGLPCYYAVGVFRR